MEVGWKKKKKMKGKKFPESYAGLYRLWYGYDKLCSGGN